MASYGKIPGKGNPTADDKTLNAPEGWVVPYKVAKTNEFKDLAKHMGWNPNATMDMNAGGKSGNPIKISSKEFFLNKDQVAQLEDAGIDPRSLSPESEHNENYTPMEFSNEMQAAAKGGKVKKRKKKSTYPYPSLANQNNNLNNSGGETNSYEEGGPNLMDYAYQNGGPHSPEEDASIIESIINAGTITRDQLAQGFRWGKDGNVYNKNWTGAVGASGMTGMTGVTGGPPIPPTGVTGVMGTSRDGGGPGQSGSINPGATGGLSINPTSGPGNYGPALNIEPRWSENRFYSSADLAGNRVGWYGTTEQDNEINRLMNEEGYVFNPVTGDFGPASSFQTGATSSGGLAGNAAQLFNTASNTASNTGGNTGGGSPSGGGGGSNTPPSSGGNTGGGSPANNQTTGSDGTSVTGGVNIPKLTQQSDEPAPLGPGLYSDEEGNVYEKGRTGKYRARWNKAMYDQAELPEFGDIPIDLETDWVDTETVNEAVLTPYTEPEEKITIDESWKKQIGEDPTSELYDQVGDMLDKNKRNKNAWLAGAAINNMLSKPGELTKPSKVIAPVVEMDLETERRKQYEKINRGSTKAQRTLTEMGDPSAIVGVQANELSAKTNVDANIQDTKNKLAQYNAANEMRSLLDYEQAMRQRNMAQAQIEGRHFENTSKANSTLLQAKLDADDQYATNKTYLEKLIADNKNKQLDDEYDALDPEAVIKKHGYIPRSSWKRLPEELRKNISALTSST